MKSFEDHGILTIETEKLYAELELAGYVYEPMDDDGRIIFRWLL